MVAGGAAVTEPEENAGPASVLTLTPGVRIPLAELTWRFSASGGPGGQHVNTSNTRVEVRFDAAGSPSLPPWARQRIVERLGPVVTVTVSDERSQVRNRSLATDRLASRLARALEDSPPRVWTRPTLASVRRRLEHKRRRGTRKRERRFHAEGDEG
jgi:ribosome-associated protein